MVIVRTASRCCKLPSFCLGDVLQARTICVAGGVWFEMGARKRRLRPELMQWLYSLLGAVRARKWSLLEKLQHQQPTWQRRLLSTRHRLLLENPTHLLSCRTQGLLRSIQQAAGSRSGTRRLHTAAASCSKPSICAL